MMWRLNYFFTLMFPYLIIIAGHSLNWYLNQSLVSNEAVILFSTLSIVLIRGNGDLFRKFDINTNAAEDNAFTRQRYSEALSRFDLFCKKMSYIHALLIFLYTFTLNALTAKLTTPNPYVPMMRDIIINHHYIISFDIKVSIVAALVIFAFIYAYFSSFGSISRISQAYRDCEYISNYARRYYV